MANYPDGRYGHKPWTTDKPYVASDLAAFPPQPYIGPFASNQERLLTQAMQIGTLTGAEIQQYVRPPLPQVKLFPNRFGYETNEYGIQDIVEMTGRPVTRTDYAQQPNTTESTSRNSLGQV